MAPKRRKVSRKSKLAVVPSRPLAAGMAAISLASGADPVDRQAAAATAPAASIQAATTCSKPSEKNDDDVQTEQVAAARQRGHRMLMLKQRAAEGASKDDVRSALKADGLSNGRISQLIKTYDSLQGAQRQATSQETPAGEQQSIAPPSKKLKRVADRAAATQEERVKQKSSAGSSAASRKVPTFSKVPLPKKAKNSNSEADVAPALGAAASHMQSSTSLASPLAPLFHRMEAALGGETEATIEKDFARNGRNSCKAAFVALVLGPLGANYSKVRELVQHVYDLWLSSALGGKKNSVNAPMRTSMQQYSFSPEFWHTHHAALVDLVKQIGFPTLFLTISPYEWSFPYHEVVEHRMRQHLRTKLHLPVEETLHIAHVLTQTVLGYLTGFNKKGSTGKNKAWKSHILGPTDDSGKRTVITYFLRFLFPCCWSFVGLVLQWAARACRC